jgi:Lrp/AsnC family transcriptional regulator, leucine-responsive regulatory protein
LQEDGRIAISELGRRIGLSQPATSERVKRLEERGVIAGYGARIDPVALGLGMMAIIRLRTPHENMRACLKQFSEMPQVMEVFRLRGEDCFLLKVLVPSPGELETLVDSIARLVRSRLRSYCAGSHQNLSDGRWFSDFDDLQLPDRSAQPTKCSYARGGAQRRSFMIWGRPAVRAPWLLGLISISHPKRLRYKRHPERLLVQIIRARVTGLYFPLSRHRAVLEPFALIRPLTAVGWEPRFCSP